MTGETTADVLDVGIVSGLLTDWCHSIHELFASQAPRLVFRTFLVIVKLFAFYQGGAISFVGMFNGHSTHPATEYFFCYAECSSPQRAISCC